MTRGHLAFFFFGVSGGAGLTYALERFTEWWYKRRSG